MAKVLISFSTKEYKASQKLLFETAGKFGIDRCISYSKRDLHKTDFYKKNKYILDQQQGAGYWLWKPYFILETLKTLNPDDILFYCDSGIEIISDLHELFIICETHQGLVFTRLFCKIKDWTKRDCFVLMNMDLPEIQMAFMVNAGFCFFMNNSKNISFITKWLDFAQNKRIITDLPNSCGLDNYLGFNAHRHDQSILSILVAKNNLEVYRDPSQYGNEMREKFSNSNYPQLFNLHRRRNISLFRKKIFIMKSIAFKIYKNIVKVLT
jgi:hypothetical protein